MAFLRQRRGSVGVVLAAGKGTRVGRDTNKAYISLAGRRMVSWSLHALAAVPELSRLLLVVREAELERARSIVERECPDLGVELVVGGATRHQSELAALQHISDDIASGRADIVLIHDGARPLAGTEMMRAALSVAREFGGAIPALEVSGLVAVNDEGAVVPVSGGEAVVRVQTPQAFRAPELLRAYLAADAAGFEGTDTSSCMENFSDTEIRTFAGHERNLKVTYAHDVFLAEKLLAMHHYRL
ncbi:2-C-methyl-D-erythritol 4-phosphate cytidylyltransferase [Williamsia sp. CHRR-6]|uniref:IspD/TarI family cytidylyltransferase n=1 Tax=Williamsia sp. CHRR-6 TaxID=2835871 RepID=UPI001BDACEB4|nr:IspD/TarI family cytidylyltransferase [Williamsia sp. CHRR-6]MBT0566047.1 2-C-methyl-D-erythritol 4-phosphate cytidylyltransferase [Williamsia sp. CHRR-6]